MSLATLTPPVLPELQPTGKARRLVPLLASVCFITGGNAAVTTGVSVSLGRYDDAASILTVVLTAYPAGFLAGCLMARPLVSRAGHRGAFCLVAGLAMLSTCLYATTGIWPAWTALRLLNGASLAAMFVVVESWINLYASRQNRGFFFALYMMTTSLAVLVGQLVVEAAGPRSVALFPLAAALMAAGLAVALAAGPWPALQGAGSSRDEPAIPLAERRRGLLRLAVAAPVTLAAVFLAGMTNINVYALMPIYAARVGLSASQAVALVTAFSVGGLLAQTPAGWLSDRCDRRAMLLVQGLLAVGCCATVLSVGAGAMGLLLALFFVYGAIALTIYPVGIAFANAHLESRQMVSAAGALLLLYSLGNILTPSLASVLMTRLAPQALFVLLGGGASLLATVAALDLLRRGRSRPSETIAHGH